MKREEKKTGRKIRICDKHVEAIKIQKELDQKKREG